MTRDIPIKKSMHELVFKVKMACTLFSLLLADLVGIFVCVLWISYWLFLSASSTIVSRLVSRSQTLTQLTALYCSWRVASVTCDVFRNSFVPRTKSQSGNETREAVINFFPAWPFDFFFGHRGANFPGNHIKGGWREDAKRWDKKGKCVDRRTRFQWPDVLLWRCIAILFGLKVTRL